VKLGFFKAHLKQKHEKFYKHYVGEPDIGNVEPLKLKMSPVVVIPEGERVMKTPEMLDVLRAIDGEKDKENVMDDSMEDSTGTVDKSEISENDKKLLSESEIRNVSWPQFFVRMQPGFLRRMFQNYQ